MRRHQGGRAGGQPGCVRADRRKPSQHPWEARVARRERERAERRFNDVRRVANSLLFDVHDAIRDLPGSMPARQLIVANAREFLNRLAEDGEYDRPLQRELAAAWERVGDVQGQTREANHSEWSAALASYRKALAIRERLAGESPAEREIRTELLPTYGKLSDLLWTAGDSSGSISYSRKLVALSEQLAGGDSATHQDRVRLATSYLDYGYKLGAVAGDLENGLVYCRKSLEIFHELSRANPNDRRPLRVLSIADDRTAELLERMPFELQAQGRGEAMKLRLASLAIRNGLLQEEPLNTEYRRLAARGHYDLGRALLGEDPKEALAQFRLALEAFQQLSDNEPASPQSAQDLAMGQVGVASAFLRMKRYSDALSWYRRGLPRLLEREENGQLQKGDTDKLEEAQRELEQCERAVRAR